MLFEGVMITKLSGKLDGLVASHNRGGAYFRTAVIPVDPASTQQTLMRAAMSDAEAAWVAMDQPTRELWNSYANTLQLTNRIGHRHTPTGRNAFFQFALPQYQQVEALDPGRVVPETPPHRPPADFTTSPTFVINPGNTTLDFSWPIGGWEDSGEAADGIVIHVSRPRNPTINWYQGPYQPAWWIESDEDSPPAPPVTLTIPAEFRPVTGQRLWLRCRLFREDRPNGRLWDLSAAAP